MKTATITFHAPNNNGSFLQAYALQQILTNEVGVENVIIDYSSDSQIRQYSLLRFPHSVGDLGRNLISLMHYPSLKRRVSRFEEIRKTYLKMTPRYTKASEVYAEAQDYDAVICVSDQIWNTGARDYSDVYFMPEFNKKKISYAVSFGSDTKTIDKERVKGFLSGFSAVSAREKAGCDFLSEMGIDSRVMCDPTLLLKKSDYIPLMSKKAEADGKYIFLYTINYGDSVLQTAKAVSEKYGLPVYTPFTGYSAEKAKKYGIKVLYDVAPAQFLRLINDAEYVCTNSFHGTAFSVIFEKKFFRMGKWDAEKGALVEDDRIDGLLERIGLTDCTAYVVGTETVIPAPEWNYSDVETKTEDIRNAAVDFLRETLLDR